jgi:hypothetical protein
LFIGDSFNYNESIPIAYGYDWLFKCYGMKYGASYTSNTALPYDNKYLHSINLTEYSCVWLVSVFTSVNANSNGILLFTFN